MVDTPFPRVAGPQEPEPRKSVDITVKVPVKTMETITAAALFAQIAVPEFIVLGAFRHATTVCPGNRDKERADK